MNKVVFVKAHFKALGVYQTVKVPTGEKKKGLLGGEKEVTRKEERWVQTGYSDREIDGKRLAQDVQKAVDKLNHDGYEVVSATPIVSGEYNWKSSDYIHTSYGYGYGFSYTEGIILVARKAP